MCGARYREIAFGLWPRKNPAEGEIAYRINFNMRWVWPRFYVQYIRD
jgi:hypothetical protein